jgi:hypothetical protein
VVVAPHTVVSLVTTIVVAGTVNVPGVGKTVKIGVGRITDDDGVTLTVIVVKLVEWTVVTAVIVSVSKLTASSHPQCFPS